MSRSEDRRPVITGWGVATPLGHGREAFAAGLLAGASGAGPIEAFDATGFPCRIAAEVPPYNLNERTPGWSLAGVVGTGDRKLELGLLAAYEALAHARALAPGTVDAVSLGAGLSSVLPDEVERELLPHLDATAGFDPGSFARSSLRDLRSAPRHRPGRATRLLASCAGATGLQATHFSACAASAQAIGLAARWIRRGEAVRVLAGGADSMVHPFGLASFTLLGTLSLRNDEPHRASRPFDRGRDGFLLAEGAAMVVVESLASARARGVEPLAEVLGVGDSLAAHQVTAPPPAGRGAALALRRALADAELRPEDVDYVNAHGTATQLNDPVEITAFRRVFGSAAERCPISSTKSMHGHLIGAAGAVEACAVLVALRRQVLPPTINVDELDPQCEADVIPWHPRPARVRAALSNSFGFGGQNACLVLATPSDAEVAPSSGRRDA